MREIYLADVFREASDNVELMRICRERVALGIAWLNEEKDDWQSLIDLSILRMDHGDYCILGQVFAELDDERCGYGAAQENYDFSDRWAEERGFYTHSVLSSNLPHDVVYSALTAEWRERIQSMRGE